MTCSCSWSAVDRKPGREVSRGQGAGREYNVLVRDSGRKGECGITFITVRYLSSHERHESMSKSLAVLRSPGNLSGSATRSVMSSTRETETVAFSFFFEALDDCDGVIERWCVVG